MSKLLLTSLVNRRRQDIFAVSIVLAFFVACFLPIILQGKFFLMLDSFTEMLPERVVAWKAIRQGTLPLWTPLILSGYPHLSMSQMALAYPLTWGYLVLPPYWAEQIYVLAPFILTPIFTYCYARTLQLTRAACLLAALAFGYGGILIMPDIPNGLQQNAMMWLPLLLIAIEHSRKADLLKGLLWTTAAYSPSVLTGYGQGFLLIGIVGLAYALYLGLVSVRQDTKVIRLSWFSSKRWRPLLVTVGAIALAAGLASFQILETMRAQRRSIRATLSYEMFTDPSPTFWEAIKFVVAAPFFSFQDVCSGYIAPLALILAAIAVYLFLKKQIRDLRIVFWLLTFVSTWILMLGANTPVYRLLYHVPILNKFREPSRHAVIWTFAVAILSAYGLDVWSRKIMPAVKTNVRWVTGIITLVLLCGGLSIYWSMGLNFELKEFLTIKAILTVLVSLTLWYALKMPGRLREGLVMVVVAWACFAEPFVLITHWWWPRTKPASRVTNPTTPTRFLQQFPPEQNRIYTFVEIFSEEFNPQPAIDCPNLTMLYGLHNVAGYEPLLLERYSKALGNVSLDAVTTLPDQAPDRNLFRAESKVLDILNNTYLLTFSNPLNQFDNTIEKDGVRFAKRHRKVDLHPGRGVEFSAMGARADTIAIVSALANSAASQGMPVATLKVTTMDGRTIERQLLAGVDTAEWAHERPDVKDVVGHSLAPIFETYPGDPENSFPAYKYWSRIQLGATNELERLEVINLTRQMTLTLDRITVYDSTTAHSTAIALAAGPVDLQKWKPVYNDRGVIIFKNDKALPRAWLVAEAEAVDAEEALRRIRGHDGGRFDPRQTALLEIKPENLPKLPGGSLAGSVARIVNYEANRLVLETEAPTAAVLVLSEIAYPGWVARVDGQEVPIHTANFLLRSVLLPAGKHQVEMRYTAPALRKGLLISGFTLGLLGGMVILVTRPSWRLRSFR